MTTIDKLTKTPAPNTVYETVNKLIDAVEQGGGGGGGTATDVQINGTSITSSNVANIVTNSTYDATTNKIATMSDIYSRNIGEIVQSTIPLTDAGLHLLDGSLIYGNGVYADFVDYIASIYDASSNYFCSESDWQTSVTTYGVCGKFVYDSTNNTVRLPKITGFTEGTIDVTTLGDFTEAGLPNITGGIADTGNNFKGSNSPTASGAFSITKSSTSAGGYSSYNGTMVTSISLSASNSNSIYGNSDTVQPQSIKVLYYIVLANTTKTDIEVDIDEIATDLNGKADKDGSNMVASVKNFDGQWVWVRDDNKALSFTSVAEHTYDLSSILPNDSNTYLVRFQLRIRRTGSGSSGVAFRAPNTFGDNLGADSISVSTAPSSQNSYTISLIDVPIDTNRTLYVTVNNNALTNGEINALMIRRMGTNS